MSRLVAFLATLPARRWAKPVIILFGVALASTSLFTGLAADDFFHQLLLTDNHTLPGVHGRRWDLFVFATGDPAIGHAQIDSGMIGWWADPAHKIAYFRPLAAASHLFDHDVLGNSPVAMHAQNLFWFAAGLAGLAAVYARFMAPALAAFSLFLYAVDDAHGFVISWIANRNALIALALGLPVLLLHDSARRGERSAARYLAPALLFVALLAGESATAVCAYLFAYAFFFEEHRRPGERVLSLAPYAAVVVAWRILYAALGYGTRGSGLAIDPVADPAGYAVAVIDRLPALLLGAFALPPSDLWELYPLLNDWLPWLMRGVAVFVLGLVVALLWPEGRRDRTLRFWAVGTVLAALPACAQVPHDRLLLYAGVGAMPLVARLITSLYQRIAAGNALRRVLLVPVFAVFFFIHVPFAVWGLPLRSQGAAHVTQMLARADRTIPAGDAARDQTVILVNPPNDAFGGYIVMQRAAEGRTRPKHIRWLATGTSAVTVERLDARTVRITPENGFLSIAGEWMQRSPENPMPAGYEIALTGVTFRVDQLNAAGRPASATATFSEPLESATMQWLKWTNDGYAAFTLPAVGAKVTLPKIDFTALDDE